MSVIVVTGHIRVRPDQMEELRPHMRAVLEATRKETGCILYAFGEDVLDPGLIRIVERWRDWDVLAVHGQAPHMQPWRDAIKAIGGTLSREVTAHETGKEKAL